MAKALGIIGNIKGKVGNVVGYNLTDSNNKQTQGLRVYQPNVKNPKTAAQAEQRAKLAPINATYRALKMIIDRGNEGLPYGNKSRLAWLKDAFNAELMPWINKGESVTAPVICTLTKGSLPNVEFDAGEDAMAITCNGVTSSTEINTVGKLAEALMNGYSFLKAGDQVTFVTLGYLNGALNAVVKSIVLETGDDNPISGFEAQSSRINYEPMGGAKYGAVIISREGTDGAHLRSTTVLGIDSNYSSSAPYDPSSQNRAVKSYMAKVNANSDWSEEAM